MINGEYLINTNVLFLEQLFQKQQDRLTEFNFPRS